MCSEGYLEYLLCANDTIYMDTSTLMNVDALRIFLETGEKLFREYDKKVTITHFVINELDKHLKNPTKEKVVYEVLKILFRFSDVFYIEKEEDLRESFADAAFLSRLIRDKNVLRQLLISSDKELREDAVRLNKQYSCKGNTIMVCHINRYGDITREKTTKAKLETACIRDTKQNSFVKEESGSEKVPQEVYVNVQKKPESLYRKWEKPAVFLGGIVGGIIVDQVITRCIRPMLISA